jgi:hypothetical protein
MGYSLSGSEAILAKYLAELDGQWSGTAAVWQDKAREDFEKEFLDELRRAANDARHGMRHIDQLLQQVIHECS